MRIFSSLFFLVCLAGTASAYVRAAPAPEMASGVVGMTLAAGLIYLINRRKRS